MKQTVLGKPKAAYHKDIKRHRALWIACAAVVVCLNVLFLVLRTDENHSVMLLANILISSLGGCFLVAYAGLVLQPMQKLYALACRPAERLQVSIKSIDDKTERVEHFDCCRVCTEGRVFFLIADTIPLEAGGQAVLTVASGIITGVEQL